MQPPPGRCMRRIQLICDRRQIPSQLLFTLIAEANITPTLIREGIIHRLKNGLRHGISKKFLFCVARAWNTVGPGESQFVALPMQFLVSSTSQGWRLHFSQSPTFLLLLKPYCVTCFISSIFSLSSSLTSLSSF